VRASASDLVVWSLAEKQIRLVLGQHNIHHITVSPEFAANAEKRVKPTCDITGA
jgi:hypothetical protein